jgi:signal transduction histidine kinase
MNGKKALYIIGIIASAFLITYLHYSTVVTIHALHDIYRELYYIPLLIGALAFGFRGAFLTYLFISILYLPYLIGSWTGQFLLDIKRILFLFFAALFSFVAGFLVDRDRKRKKQMERERYLAGIGEVASSIVHDLKNPLLTIQGFARRTEEGKGDPSVAARAILDSAEVMQGIVRSVLDFAKPMHLDMKEENVGDVIRKACELCREKAEEKAVDLSIRIPDVRWNIRLDSVQMQRALANLISNAIEASGRGQVVTVGTDSKGDFLLITITDRGAGMDKETLENLFIPFFTKKSAGTGLGMPAAKKIIEGHDGKIRIESRPGKGTQIIILLPFFKENR